MSSVDPAFGEWSRRTRAALDDLTQEWVAGQIGVGRPTVNKMETGAVKPSKRMLRELPLLYEREAARLSRVIEPPPNPALPESASPSPGALDARLYALMEDQTEAIRESARAHQESAQANRAVAQALASLAASMLTTRQETLEGQEALAELLGEVQAALDRVRTPSGERNGGR